MENYSQLIILFMHMIILWSILWYDKSNKFNCGWAGEDNCSLLYGITNEAPTIKLGIENCGKLYGLSNAIMVDC